MNPAGTGPLTTQLSGNPQSAVVQTLQRQIRRLETAGRCEAGPAISTGCEELDALLPEGGLVPGTITEWLTPAVGHGAMMLSLVAARSASAGGGALVVIDPDRCFYPPAALAWGIDPAQVIVLRPPRQDRGALYWAIDQALRCPAVAAVWGPLDQVDERWQRRFQLSAEDSGTVGLFVRPARVQGCPGWADVQWLVGQPVGQALRDRPTVAEVAETSDDEVDRPSPALRTSASPVESAPSRRGRGDEPPLSFARQVSLRLLRVRGGLARPHQPITLQIDFTTGTLRKIHNAKSNHSENPVAGHGVPRPQNGAASPGKKHSGHLAALLAHPATGGRRQRA